MKRMIFVEEPMSQPGPARKKSHSKSTRKLLPQLLAENATLAHEDALSLIKSILVKNGDEISAMDIDESKQGVVLFFLDAQGKEQIRSILDIFQSSPHIVLFISSNLGKFPDEALRIYSDSQNCKILSTYFGVLDPLGGGQYPLNYMVFLDADWLVRCQIPLRFKYYYEGYQKFGLDLTQLQGFVDEYMDLF